jgi:hypothetical protein
MQARKKGKRKKKKEKRKEKSEIKRVSTSDLVNTHFIVFRGRMLEIESSFSTSLDSLLKALT